MTGARHLALGLPTGQRRAGPRRPKVLLLAGLAIVLLAAVAVFFLLRSQQTESAENNGPSKRAQSLPSAISGLPPPDLLRPLTPEEAIKANAATPILLRPDSAAARFVVSGDTISKLRALDCLTQAIYYEAASEGADGGRAVAQIVLNRMRHPAYPNSVCGVVYEGSARTTGCQFSFTCDGSLRKTPLAYLWARSRTLATEALAGRVFAPVGHATHYHADYVLPYWASSLDKVAIIGRHIFYRLRGRGGASAVFVQRYAQQEATPLPPPAPSEAIEQGLDSVLPEAATVPSLADLPKVEEDRIKVLETAPTIESPASRPLEADLTRGTLIVGEPAPAPKAKRAESAGCQQEGSARIEAAKSNNLSANSAKAGC